MAQEITIIVMIDVEAAIEDNSLKGNIYLTDNLRTEGSQGEGTDKLITAIKGGYWSDGTQSAEQLLNWLIGGISSFPPSLPRDYHVHRSKMIEQHKLQKLTRQLNAQDKSNGQDFTSKLQETLRMIGDTSYIKDAQGNERDLGAKVLNVLGEPYDKETESPTNISYLPPIITDISGEAVDKRVIYPAQYGTPISINDGWYWSASTDTSITGCYAYTMHITMYKPSYVRSHVDKKMRWVWEPVHMTHDAYLHVTNAPMRNGFTGGAMGMIPVL